MSYFALTSSMNGTRSFEDRRVNAAHVRFLTWSLVLQSIDWSSTILFRAFWSAWSVALISSPLACALDGGALAFHDAALLSVVFYRHLHLRLTLFIGLVRFRS